MREISTQQIIQAVKKLCINANCILNDDVYCAIKNAKQSEISPIGQELLEQLIQNADIAKKQYIPICQDTGMTVIFIKLGQDVHIKGGLLNDAIHEGVRQGYQEGFLRKSIVEDPFLRINTNDNTPAIIHYEIVEGEQFEITVAPKGFGSENMSRLYMLKPSDGIEGAKKVILQTVEEAGPNPCPPMIVGVGCGGDFEMSAFLAKKALLRPVGIHSPKEHIKQMEIELLEKMNQMGIGPQGLGGKATVLGVNVETYPTHIAGLPVAVNISCHVTRHAQIIL